MYELCGNLVCLFATRSPAPNAPLRILQPFATSRPCFCINSAYMCSTCLIKDTWIRPEKPERALHCDLFLLYVGGIHCINSACKKTKMYRYC